jgi:hypothetical protein
LLGVGERTSYGRPLLLEHCAWCKNINEPSSLLPFLASFAQPDKRYFTSTASLVHAEVSTQIFEYLKTFLRHISTTVEIDSYRYAAPAILAYTTHMFAHSG